MKKIIKISIDETELSMIPFVFEKRTHVLDLNIGDKIKIIVEYLVDNIKKQKYIIIPISDIKEGEFKRLLFFKGCDDVFLEISRDAFIQLY